MKLSVVNLSKKYGGFTALDSVSFELEFGIYGILGLNGAGKTTLINLITDNLKRTSGNIYLDGAEILTLGGRYRDLLGYMPQEQGYYGAFTARSYLYYMASLKGIQRKTAIKRIDSLLQRFHLEKAADQKMSTYSGGMRQRAVLCQALLNDPKLLILDEPTAGLDPKERIQFKAYMKSIAANRIVLYCTHVVSDIEEIADQVLLMKGGRIVKMCPAKDLCAELPENRAWNMEQAFLYYMENTKESYNL